MSAQTELDFAQPQIGAWREGQPDTARQAAVAQCGRLGTQKIRCLAEFYRRGAEGATGDELAAASGIAYAHIASTRRRALETAGLVEATDERRPTRLGSPAVVYRITELGVAVWRAMREAE